MLALNRPDLCPFCGSDNLKIYDVVCAMTAFSHSFMPVEVKCRTCGKKHGQMCVFDASNELLLALQFAKLADDDNSN